METSPIREAVSQEMIQAALESPAIRHWHRLVLLAWFKNGNQPLSIADMVRAGMTGAGTILEMQARLSNLKAALTTAKATISVCADPPFAEGGGLKQKFANEHAEREWVLTRTFRLFVSTPRRSRISSD